MFNNPWFWILLASFVAIAVVFAVTLLRRDLQNVVRSELAHYTIGVDGKLGHKFDAANPKDVAVLVDSLGSTGNMSGYSTVDRSAHHTRRRTPTKYLQPYPSFEEMATDLDDDHDHLHGHTHSHL